MVTRIPVAFDSVGTATSFANILRDYSSIKLETIQLVAIGRFSTAIVFTDPIPAPPFTTRVLDPANNTADKPIFHSRVNSHPLAKFLDNILTEEAMGVLVLRKDEYTFLNLISGHESRDVPIMILLAMQKADPSTIVGVDILRSKIEKASLHTYKIMST